MINLIVIGLCLGKVFANWGTMFPNKRSSLEDCKQRFYDIPPYRVEYGPYGTLVKTREFPHMAAIGWMDSNGTILWRCGGSLIWYNFVLTAAHCMVDSRGEPPDVVRLGDIDFSSSDNDDQAQQFRISKIIRHPEFRFKASYHDIALLKLDKNVEITPFVIPACLWTEEQFRFKTLVATGWGRTGYGADYSPNLLKFSLKPVPNEECSQHYAFVRQLKQGLKDQHLCAFDEKMDTCEGDSGGPLQVKLMNNGRMTPFILGITSFGVACGVSIPGVYTRVSSYFKWIVDTMRLNGAVELEENYNETFCALRFVSLREFYKPEYKVTSEGNLSYSGWSYDHNEEKSPEVLAKINWHEQGPDCYGVIIDEDTVLTVADCTSYNGKPPSFITYLEDKTTPIWNVFVHPEHIRGTAYKNIAILKLKNLLDLPLQFHPSCISARYSDWYQTFLYGRGRRDINDYKNQGAKNAIDPRQSTRQIRTFSLNSTSCIVPNQFLSRLTNGLDPDNLCFGNEGFLVPKSCEQLTGSMIGYYFQGFFTSVALSLFSLDCGFGEHLISTRLGSQFEWLKSLLLPDYQDSSAINYVDIQLQECDNCSLGSGLEGQCVPEDMCKNQLRRPTGQITFCSSVTVICCSSQNIDISSRIHPDIDSCPKLVKDLPRTTSNGSLVGIYIPLANNSTKFECFGSVISRSTVITSASCLQNITRVEVLIGSNVQIVESIMVHRGFNMTDRTNDIALIKLKNPLIWNATVFPICLWTNMTHTPIELDNNLDSGRNPGNTKKNHPMYGSDCQRSYQHQLKDSQLCTRSPYVNASCVSPGDQLIWADLNDKMHYLVGLSTNSCKQVEWKFSIYTRISAFLEWISEHAF